MKSVCLIIISLLFLSGCKKEPKHYNSVAEQIIGEWRMQINGSKGGEIPESVTLIFKNNNLLEEISEGYGNSPFHSNGKWNIINDSLITELREKRSNLFKIKDDTLFVLGNYKDGSEYTHKYVRE